MTCVNLTQWHGKKGFMTPCYNGGNFWEGGLNFS